MSEYPILFNAEMVRAILDGRKTQTRRPVKPQPKVNFDYDPRTGVIEINPVFQEPQRITSPYGPLGSRLWVRETCHAEQLESQQASMEFDESKNDMCGVRYLADGHFRPIANSRDSAEKWDKLRDYGGETRTPYLWRKVPSIHMPRWASRITLEVTALRVERLQSITANDARAEGFDGDKAPQFPFSVAWDSIYKSKGYGWDNNPWVWAYEFKVAETRKHVGVG